MTISRSLVVGYLRPISSGFTVSTAGTLEVLLLFLPLPGVDEEVSSRSPPPLTLLEGEVALLLLELIDMARWFVNSRADQLQKQRGVKVTAFV